MNWRAAWFCLALWLVVEGIDQETAWSTVGLVIVGSLWLSNGEALCRAAVRRVTEWVRG